MFIYKTTNVINGKMYIGLCTRDAPTYLGSGKLLTAAIKKYGRANFIRDIIEECDDFEYLCEREIFYIEECDAVNSDKYYNLSYGGQSDPKLMKEYWASMTSEQRKASRNWKGHFIGLDQSGDKHISKTNADWCNNVSKAVKNSWDAYTDEERIARGNIVSERRIALGSAKGKNNPMFGRSAITEQKLKWYTDGIDTIYVPEGTQSESYRRGRTFKKQSV